MSIHNDPGHGFAINIDDDQWLTGTDLGSKIYLSTKGMYGQMTLTPMEARTLAIALVQWADEKDGIA